MARGIYRVEGFAGAIPADSPEHALHLAKGFAAQLLAFARTHVGIAAGSHPMVIAVRSHAGRLLSRKSIPEVVCEVDYETQ